MPNGCCCVPGCSNRGGHCFPAENERRQKWIIAVKRDGFQPTRHSIVCRKHFLETDYHRSKYSFYGTERKQNYLRKDAVPSVFPWTKQKTAAQMRREERQTQKLAMVTKIAADEWAKKREEAEKNKVYSESDIQVYVEVDVQSEATTFEAAAYESTETTYYVYPAFSDVVTSSADSYCDVEPETSKDSVQTPTSSSKFQVSSFTSTFRPHLGHSSMGTITNNTPITASYMYVFPTADDADDDDDDQELPAIEKVHDKAHPVIQSGGEDQVPGAEKQKTEPYLSVDAIKESDEVVHFYTGLQTYDAFLHAFWSLGDNVNHLKYAYSSRCKCLSPQNQFLLMLVKLRLYSPHSELARLFQVSEFTVQNVFVTWVNFCYFQWKEVDWWPERDLVSHYCPTDFKRKFPSTPVIVDATEIRVNVPSNPESQKASFSSYKHGSTMKVLVGVTPGGLISFVSDAYGGSSSDRQVVESSTLTTLCAPYDSIMADKGSNVQKNRLTPATRQKNRNISRKRVHVERVIGMAKVYTICKHRLNVLETKLATQIISVCFFLCNFRKTTVGRFA